MRNYRHILLERKGQRQQVEKQLQEQKRFLALYTEEQGNLEQAQALIQEVAKQTQEALKYHISELVTLALAAVFHDPYEFEVDFQQRRNQTEADLFFVRDGERVDPLTASGGGAVDIAAFALRVSAWSMKNPHTRPTLILDEPFSRLKGKEANIKAIQLVKRVSNELGIQILMVSDERVPLAEIEAGADKVFYVGIKKGKSYVEE